MPGPTNRQHPDHQSTKKEHGPFANQKDKNTQGLKLWSYHVSARSCTPNALLGMHTETYITVTRGGLLLSHSVCTADYFNSV